MCKEDADLVPIIKELVGLWYQCLIGHHKDRDCHFYVNEEFQYDGDREYTVSHNGYIAGEFYKTVDSHRDAYIWLGEKLVRMIMKEAGWYLNVGIKEAEDKVEFGCSFPTQIYNEKTKKWDKPVGLDYWRKEFGRIVARAEELAKEIKNVKRVA